MTSSLEFRNASAHFRGQMPHVRHSAFAGKLSPLQHDMFTRFTKRYCASAVRSLCRKFSNRMPEVTCNHSDISRVILPVHSCYTVRIIAISLLLTSQSNISFARLMVGRDFQNWSPAVAVHFIAKNLNAHLPQGTIRRISVSVFPRHRTRQKRD